MNTVSTIPVPFIVSPARAGPMTLVSLDPPCLHGSQAFRREPELQSRCLILAMVWVSRDSAVLRLIGLFFAGAVTLLIGFTGGAWYAQTLPLSVLVPGTVQAADHTSPPGKSDLAASSSAVLRVAGPVQ